MATYLRLRTRTQYLRGEEDTAGETVINDHIQAAIEDIVNKYPFSWAQASETISDGDALSTLTYTINQKWGMRVLDDDGNEYTRILPEDQYKYTGTDYKVFWISASTFQTTSTDALNIHYYYIPAAMTGDSDVCIIPDGEAVAYLAASKMFIGDERNDKLQSIYEKEANDRIVSMWQADNSFGPIIMEGSVLDYNEQITG